MTHTLNRKGLSEANPGEEIVVLCMINQQEIEQKQERMDSIVETVLKYKPDNIIGAPGGLNEEQLRERLPRGSIITAVFNNMDDVRKLVGEMKSKKLGISMVLSGLFSDVRDICISNGLTEHTYNISLGVFGKTDKLPEEKVLEITTQCGHALISPNLVKHVVQKINREKMTAAEGARMLTKPCVCGIGNPLRMEKLLTKIAAAN
ncbi:MAG: hypothetical protein JRD68_08120 [Deltaproteobacteria bacterium]|nr:hypothetical protein [Deltaproteobacteria bacterium]